MGQEELGEGRSEWRGKAQHVQSGEVWYFRQWSALEALRQRILEFQATCAGAPAPPEASALTQLFAQDRRR